MQPVCGRRENSVGVRERLLRRGGRWWERMPTMLPIAEAAFSNAAGVWSALENASLREVVGARGAGAYIRFQQQSVNRSGEGVLSRPVAFSARAHSLMRTPRCGLRIIHAR